MNATVRRPVGVVGLGAMGMGVAMSLLREGFEVHACDVRPDLVQKVVDAGGLRAESPAALAPLVEVLIIVVLNAEQTESVLFGENGAAARMRPGSLVIACPTVSPEFAKALGKRLTDAGLLMLDAPISGGAAKALAGEMTVMSSGAPEAYAQCEDVLAAIAGQVYRLGNEIGAGSVTKMINQVLAGIHVAAAGEAMALAIRAGADPEKIYEVITHSAGSSWMFENRVPHILTGDYSPLSQVNIFIKDLGIVLDYAKKAVFPLPLVAAAHQMYLSASAAGHGAEDDSAVIKIFPGIDLPEAKK
ncbi:MAG: NAD(P)-dependent oxidoreductase [Candidatus Accumulibacter sp.]|jgi:3-hydroxyisobutyrate dehydrogenase|nr:NAD(P)-dependent oxidoreductase [Accumulibacter sp.]